MYWIYKYILNWVNLIFVIIHIFKIWMVKSQMVYTLKQRRGLKQCSHFVALWHGIEFLGVFAVHYS